MSLTMDSVWTFVLGLSCRPRHTVVGLDRGGKVRIRPHMHLFPQNARVARVPLHIDGRMYLMYLDCVHYKHICNKATYVFLRLLHRGATIDFSVEQDFPNIMQLLMMWVPMMIQWLHGITNDGRIKNAVPGIGTLMFFLQAAMAPVQ